VDERGRRHDQRRKRSIGLYEINIEALAAEDDFVSNHNEPSHVSIEKTRGNKQPEHRELDYCDRCNQEKIAQWARELPVF
jgi:hypothetical protein